jgi:serine/threonine protein kinase
MSGLQPSLPKEATIGPFPYHIEKRIGEHQGSMSEVYLARMVSVDSAQPISRVVLKIARVLDENGKFNSEGLRNEVDHLPRLTHPGIVHIFPIKWEGLPNLPYSARSSLPNEPWFSVLEYLQGGSLADLLEKYKKGLPTEWALEIARSLAGTLDYLHCRGLVHLDVKPENILFRRPLQFGQAIEPVLVDFGIAREIGQEPLGGTLIYMAPERIIGAPHGAHPSMDIYSLGMVLYKMLTGRLPFQGTRESIKTAILEGNLTTPSKYYEQDPDRHHVAEHLDKLILTNTHKDWRARPTAGDLATSLEVATIRMKYQHPLLLQSTLPQSRAATAKRQAFAQLYQMVSIALSVLAVLLVGFILYTRPGWQPYLTQGAGTVTALPSTSVVTTSVTITTPVAIATEPQTAITPGSPSSSNVVTVPAGAPVTATVAATALAVTDTATLAPTVTVPTPTETATDTPTGTPIPTSTATETPLPATAQADIPVVPTISIILMAPPDGEVTNGNLRFQWEASSPPPPNYQLETIFWPYGSTPDLNQCKPEGWAGFSIWPRTTAGVFEDNPNLAQLDINGQFEPSTYSWGVVLVMDNCRFYLLDNEQRRFTYTR